MPALFGVDRAPGGDPLSRTNPVSDMSDMSSVGESILGGRRPRLAPGDGPRRVVRHVDENERPKVVRLHLVRDELLAV